MLVIVLMAVLMHVNAFRQSSTITINTPYVSVKGRHRRSENYRPYYEYKGIPYARPPLGDLRFKEPQDIRCSDEFLQLEETPVCLQKNYLFSYSPESEGQEDCLYLNVFMPKECKVSATPCPVLVFFHWGGFFAGRSTTGYLGPEYLMDRKLVLVTANYRLGPFGFLSTSDDEAPGNYGLKDQVAALKWVRNNINRFAGNPDDVTISGQSAGGASVHYHMMSPLSENLFTKAISLSGLSMALWSYPANDIQTIIAKHQGRIVGCANLTNQQLMECLRSVPAEKFMDTQDKLRPFFGNPVGVFGPVSESASPRNPRPFITKTPLDYLSNGEVRRVPWMVGFVSNEGVMKAKSVLSTEVIRDRLNSSFESILSGPLVVLLLSAMDRHSLYKNVTEFYLNGKEYVDLNDKEFLQGFIDLFTDRAFVYPLYQTLQIHSCLGHHPIYLYEFDYVGANSYASVFSDDDKNITFNWKNCHCDDLLYLFKSPQLFPKMRKSNDQDLREYMLDVWFNFITNGDPSARGTLGDRWRPIKNTCKPLNDHLHLFRIAGDWKRGSTIGAHKGLPRNRIDFWRKADTFENSACAKALDKINKTTV